MLYLPAEVSNINLTLYAVPKDMIRLDSLKSITHHKRDNKEHAQGLDKIDEENFEDDDGNVTPVGRTPAGRSSIIGIKSQIS